MITKERFDEVLQYDKQSGEFYWKVSKRGVVRRGQMAGCIRTNQSSGKPYRVIGIDYHLYQAHRLAWLAVTGEWPVADIDHVDGDGTNNRWANLRQVTHVENQRNLRKRCDNKSGVTGVSWDSRSNKWRVQVKIKGKQMCVGRFDDFEQAVAVRHAANIKFGFHANHGSDRSL